MDVVEHMLGVVFETACNIDFRVKVHSHQGLELPQGENNGTFRIVHVRNCIGHRSLGAVQVKVRGFLRIVLLFSLFIVPQRVLINLLVNIESLFSKESGVEGILHLGNHIQTGSTRLLNGKVNRFSGNLYAFPQLGIHQRKGCGNAETQGVETTHFHSVRKGFPRRG